MLVAIPPAQPAAPLDQQAIVRTIAAPALRRRRPHGRTRFREHRRHLVFHAAEASWYGGGGSLACGGTLTNSTLGVANKTLPCGTRLTLRYEGRTVRVRVIDRGPYVAGREFDLTEATKRALGFGDLGEVWWSLS